MKRSFSVLVLMALLGFVSCTKEIVPASNTGEAKPGEEVMVTITAQTPNQGIKKKSAFENPALADMRVVLMVMESNGTLKQSIIKEHENYTGPITFEVRVVVGQQYKIACWADFGDNYYTLSVSDGTIPNVKINGAGAELSFAGSNNLRDAYFNYIDTDFSTNLTINLDLKRPFGLIKVNTLDFAAISAAGEYPLNYNASFKLPSSMGLGMTLSDGKVINNLTTNNIVKISETAVSTPAVSTTTGELSFDYFFINQDGEGFSGDLIDNLNITYKKQQGTPLDVNLSFSNIPVRRNYITNISGNLFTGNAKIIVKISPDWAGSIPVTESTVFITNQAELTQAIKDQVAGQTIVIKGGPDPYNIPISTITANGGTQWYLPIIKNGVTIIGIGNPILTSETITPNGAWSLQNLITVLADDVTIDGVTIKTKLDPNKVIEVLGNNFTLKNSKIIVNEGYDQFAGSLYFNNSTTNGFVATIENCELNNSAIATVDLTATSAKVIIDNVTINANNQFCKDWNSSSVIMNVISANASTVMDLVGSLTINIDPAMSSVTFVLTNTNTRAKSGTIINGVTKP